MFRTVLQTARQLAAINNKKRRCLIGICVIPSLNHFSCAFLGSPTKTSFFHLFPYALHTHTGLTDFKQPVAKPTNSFNSSIPLSLEHHLIILVIMPATPTAPPLLYNGIWPEQKKKKTMFLLKCIWLLLFVCTSLHFLLSVLQCAIHIKCRVINM